MFLHDRWVWPVRLPNSRLTEVFPSLTSIFIMQTGCLWTPMWYSFHWLGRHNGWPIISEPFRFIENGIEQGCPCIIVWSSTVVAFNKLPKINWPTLTNYYDMATWKSIQQSLPMCIDGHASWCDVFNHSSTSHGIFLGHDHKYQFQMK